MISRVPVINSYKGTKKHVRMEKRGTPHCVSLHLCPKVSICGQIDCTLFKTSKRKIHQMLILQSFFLSWSVYHPKNLLNGYQVHVKNLKDYVLKLFLFCFYSIRIFCVILMSSNHINWFHFNNSFSGRGICNCILGFNQRNNLIQNTHKTFFKLYSKNCVV